MPAFDCLGDPVRRRILRPCIDGEGAAREVGTDASDQSDAVRLEARTSGTRLRAVLSHRSGAQPTHRWNRVGAGDRQTRRCQPWRCGHAMEQARHRLHLHSADPRPSPQPTTPIAHGTHTRVRGRVAMTRVLIIEDDEHPRPSVARGWRTAVTDFSCGTIRICGKK